MSTENRIYATGKRKCAVARVWLSPGTGKFTVNKKSGDEYFERESTRMVMRQALELLELTDKYDVYATVNGGGHSAQGEALRHGIARALSEGDSERRTCSAVWWPPAWHRAPRASPRWRSLRHGPRKKK